MTVRERIEAAIASYTDPVAVRAGRQALKALQKQPAVATRHDHGKWELPSEVSAEVMIEQLSDALLTVPEGIRPTAMINISSDDYGPTELTLSVERLDTDEEAIARWQSDAARLSNCYAKEWRRQPPEDFEL